MGVCNHDCLNCIHDDCINDALTHADFMAEREIDLLSGAVDPPKASRKLRAYKKQYRLDNKEKEDKYQREYYQEHAEKKKAATRKWYQANKERAAVYGREYREKNREYFKAYKRAYYQAHKATWNDYKKKGETNGSRSKS